MPKSCWERNGCSEDDRDKCRAYPLFGELCWLVAGTQRDGSERGIFHAEKKACSDCSWQKELVYKNSGRMNDHDKIINASDCWEFWGCDENTLDLCPAFPDNGKYCWMNSGLKCQNHVTNKFTKDLRPLACDECLWHLHRTNEPFMFGQDMENQATDTLH